MWCTKIVSQLLSYSKVSVVKTEADLKKALSAAKGWGTLVAKDFNFGRLKNKPQWFPNMKSKKKMVLCVLV